MNRKHNAALLTIALILSNIVWFARIAGKS